MIVLAYPFGSPLVSIELPNPDLRHHEKMATPTAFKMSASGILYGKRELLRPQTLVFTFSNLTQLKSRELEDFLAGAAGKECRFFDGDATSWKVKVSLATSEFTMTGRGNGPGVPETAQTVLQLTGNKL